MADAHDGPDSPAAHRRLGDRLVSAGLVKRDDVERAAEVAEAEGRRLGEVILEWGLVEEREIFRQLADQYQLEFSDAEALFGAVDRDAAGTLSRDQQEQLGVLPLDEEAERMRVAVCDPDADLDALAQSLCAPAGRLAPVLVTPTDLRRLQWSADLAPPESPGPDEQRASADLLQNDVRLESIHAGLFDAILAEAVAHGASDVHLEPRAGGARVRLRVDGQLRDCEHLGIDAERLRGVVSVVKVRSALDITDRRRPQEGRFTVRIAGRELDVRVQSQPTLHGEAVVLRLLSQTRSLRDLDRLGFLPGLREAFLRLLQSPTGLVLVAGPSGSGKTTTLYAGLQVLAADSTRKVITVEDPIEYAVDGVQQTQVDPEHDYTFSQAVRTLVREDPDVILIGEIRDPETALEALRASQTGHLVLATIHANDAVDAVQRLFDLGMHPNSIAAELLAVVAQRLARRLCPACRRPWEVDRSLLREVFPVGAPEDFQALRCDGCAECRGYGSRGRLAVGELLTTSRELRAAVSAHTSLDDLRQAALGAGLRSMRSEALDLVQQGFIDLRELPRLFGLEMLAGWD